jgi:UPF0755 protein
MPQNPAPTDDDPFADLFGRLPDPRRSPDGGAPTGTQAAAPATSAPGATPESAATSAGPTPPPPSRRAAREAAAREAAATGSTPAAGQGGASAAPETFVPGPFDPFASPEAPNPYADHEPALPYARTGSVPVTPAPAAPAQPAPVVPAAPADAAMRESRAEPRSRQSQPEPQHHAAQRQHDDLQDLFSGAATTNSVGRTPSKKEKKRGRRGGWIALGIVVVILGGIAGAGLWAWNTYQPQIRHVLGWEPPSDYAKGQAHGEALVTIASGDTGSSVSKALYNAGVTRTSGVFYDMLVKSGQNPTFYPGVYKLQKEMTAAAALTALNDPSTKLNNSALIREGLTESQILPILADSLKIPLADFTAAVATPSDYGVQGDTLEGWLFPALYQFDPGVTAKDVIAKMVARTQQSLANAKVPAADDERILTIASIIQREARSTDDFYKVSRVIQNRLDQGMKLQMDSTAQYGYGTLHNGTVSSSAAALSDNNPWNTYVITGLPKGPISNPGDTAIDAAMHPADGTWLYFTTVNLDTGETVFSTTYADQEKAVAQWRSWCTANPNSGC